MTMAAPQPMAPAATPPRRCGDDPGGRTRLLFAVLLSPAVVAVALALLLVALSVGVGYLSLKKSDAITASLEGRIS